MPTRSTAALALAGLLGLAGSAASAEHTAFVLTTDFSTGSLSAVDLDSRAVTLDVGQDICSDAALRWQDGLLYVINRFGCDNVLVLNPAANYSVVRQFSTGNGTNPHDIAFLSPTRAYVTRYDAASLLIVNPSNGATLGQISLAPLADADGIPEMDRMVRIGNRVFVSVQRLDRNNNFVPTDRSVVAVIDASADTLVDVDPATPGVQGITLVNKNPVTPFAFDRQSGRLLIGCAGRFLQNDGGVEWIDPDGLASAGVAVSEDALGGDLTDFAWDGPERSYAIVNDASFNTSLVSFDATTGKKLGTLFSPGGFSLADCEVNDRGELYVCDNDFLSPGVFVYSTATGLRIAGPLGTGLPPFQITFDQASSSLAAVTGPPGRLDFSIEPNPARALVRVGLRLERPEAVRVEIFDAAGRRLREWALNAGPSGANEVRWDLRDAAGARVAPGIYLARVKNNEISVVRRVAVMY
jgi:flagellar hook capping protein FlgD